MGILELLNDGDVLELDVEVLVYALEDAADLDIILELDRYLVVNEGLEEAGMRKVFVSLDFQADRTGFGGLVREVIQDGGDGSESGSSWGE